ncbi:hypothetical protein M3Y94_00191200 [Aphelenchoides besseyi]|nr:hypothetical protein M3Y94_00191200 [Aphelenchoides besseyi]KAI6236791.1 Clc-like protein [Aphelenchoides besseyi]
MNDNSKRRCCLLSGIGLTLFGCIVCGLAIALPGWQIVELSEYNSIHEHGIFYDCVRSETVPLDRVRPRDFTFRSSKRCTYKFDSTASRSIRVAIEEGDLSASEMLLHRFLPHHKAVIFFFIFGVIFALMSMIVGACSPCFVPNSIFHFISVMTATACSMLADGIFFVGAMKLENRNVQGVNEIYQQRLGYAFFVHLFGTMSLTAATLCSTVSAYLLIRREWQLHGCCNSKSVSKHAYSCESYCHYPSLTFYGMPENEGRLLDVPNGTLRMPTQPPPVTSLFATLPTRVEQRRPHGYEHFERLAHEEDV